MALRAVCTRVVAWAGLGRVVERGCFVRSSSSGTFSLVTSFRKGRRRVFSIGVGSNSALPMLPLHGVILFPKMFVPISINEGSSLELVHRTRGGGVGVTIIYRGMTRASRPRFRSLRAVKAVKGVIHVLRVPSRAAAIVLRKLGHLRLANVARARPCLGNDVRIGSRVVPSGGSGRFRTLIRAYGSLAVHCVGSSSSLRRSSTFTVGGVDGRVFLMSFVYAGLPLGGSRGVRLLHCSSLERHACHLLRVLGQRIRLTRVGTSVRVHTHRSVSRRRHRCFLRRRVGAVRSRLNNDKRRRRVRRVHGGTCGVG